MPLDNYPQPTVMVERLYDRASEYMLRSFPVRDLPLNIRPAIIFATATWLLILGVLGLAPLPELPVNDKALHFFGLGFATYLLYFVIDVPDGPARRVWYIRRAPLLLTLVTSFFFGGIMSELIQSTLPVCLIRSQLGAHPDQWKDFQLGDIVANLLGSTTFLYLAHLLHLRSRKRRELFTLYQPLSVQSSSTYRDAQGREHAFDPSVSGPAMAGPYRHREGSNVWEEGSEGRHSGEEGPGRQVFGIGDEDDNDDRLKGADAV